VTDGSELDPHAYGTGAAGGLMERVLFIEIMAWYAAVGWRLFRASGHGGPKGAGTQGRA
jgi:hypothetical protein